MFSDHGCQSNFKASSASDNRGTSVRQSRRAESRKGSVSTAPDSLFVLSAGTSSQPTTESSDRTACCGLASASDFAGRGSRSILRRDLTRLGGRQLQRPSSDSYRDI